MRTLKAWEVETCEEALEFRRSGMVQREIAEILGVPQQTVSYWVSHKDTLRVPGWKVMRAVCLSCDGWDIERIARDVSESPATVKRWIANIPANRKSTMRAMLYGPRSFEEYQQIVNTLTPANVGNDDVLPRIASVRVATITGQPPGSRDGKPRHRAGYLARYMVGK